MNTKNITCPECKIKMTEVRTSSHYGIPVVLDQCKSCGGIWFDENELFRTKQGMAKKVDKLLDGKKLKNITSLENKDLNCPRDGKKLKVLSDQNFPKMIQVEVCPFCYGLWFNQGEFIGFQKKRHERAVMRKRKTDKDSEKKLSKELSSQINATLKLYSGLKIKSEKKKKEDIIGTIMYLLWVLFRYLR